MEIGVQYARKAWLKKETIINTLTGKPIFGRLKTKKKIIYYIKHRNERRISP